MASLLTVAQEARKHETRALIRLSLRSSPLPSHSTRPQAKPERFAALGELCPIVVPRVADFCCRGPRPVVAPLPSQPATKEHEQLDPGFDSRLLRSSWALQQPTAAPSALGCVLRPTTGRQKQSPHNDSAVAVTARVAPQEPRQPSPARPLSPRPCCCRLREPG